MAFSFKFGGDAWEKKILFDKNFKIYKEKTFPALHFSAYEQ